MSQHQEQQIEPIFTIDNKYVKKCWQKLNPKNNKKQISIKELETFMKDVLKNSQQELQMQLDQNTDFIQMIQAYKQEIQQPDKQKFNLEESVQILNYILSGQDDQEQQEQQHQKQEVSKSIEKPKNQPTKKADQKQKTQVKKEVHNQKSVQKEKLSQIPQLQKQKKQEIKQAEQVKIKQQQKQDKQQKQNITHQEQDQPHTERNKENELDVKDKKQKIQVTKMHESSNIVHKQMESSHKQQNDMDWGKQSKKMQQQINKKLYKQINSYTTNQPGKMKNSYNDSQNKEICQQQQSDRIQEGSLYNIKAPQGQTVVKCPLSIKKSLAKINAKSKVKVIQKPIIPLLTISPDAPQMKYLKKLKIMIKNKKPKAPFHAQENGLKQLFKFYCRLHSQVHNTNKHKDPAKGTFDQIQKRNTQLYMHNFMLFCKDFNLIENKLSLNITNLKNKVEQMENTIQKQVQKTLKDQKSGKRRNSKGAVPQSSIKTQNKSIKDKQNPIKQKKQIKTPKIVPPIQRDLWDRDKISNYFKKEADYTLNIKYDKFIEIISIIMQNQLSEMMRNLEKQNIKEIVKDQNSKKIKNNKIKEEQPQSQEQITHNDQVQQSQNQQKNQQQQSIKENKQELNEVKNNQNNVEPQKMALCTIFKVQTEQNFEKTLKKLKIMHKIMQPPTSNTQRQKKHFKILNGQFQQNIAQSIKNKQIQRQKHHIQLKQKYLNRFNIKQVDSYSSFKKATNPTNNMNGLYGSGPKLNQSRTAENLNSLHGNSNSVLYQSAGQYTGMRKKLSKNDPLQLGSVIKQARNQIYDTNGTKQNKRKQPSKTEKLQKSRFKPLTVNTSALNSNLLHPSIGYKKLYDLKSQQVQSESISQILMNNSRIAQQGDKTNRSKKIKSKSKDLHSPLLQRMGCHQDDDVLNKFFDQQKAISKSQVIGVNYIR